jgi:hypothetical protein
MHCVLDLTSVELCSVRHFDQAIDVVAEYVKLDVDVVQETSFCDVGRSSIWRD